MKEVRHQKSIADKLYGDPELHYVVLMINDTEDTINGLLSFIQFRQYVEDKYDDPNGIHHYEVTQSSGDTTKKYGLMMWTGRWIVGRIFYNCGHKF